MTCFQSKKSTPELVNAPEPAWLRGCARIVIPGVTGSIPYVAPALEARNPCPARLSGFFIGLRFLHNLAENVVRERQRAIRASFPNRQRIYRPAL